jgi:hypothetical protein
MCSSVFSEQFADPRLTAAANLLAIEPPGTITTTCAKTDHWMYRDAAAMALQVMERLGVEEAFALVQCRGSDRCEDGTSVAWEGRFEVFTTGDKVAWHELTTDPDTRPPSSRDFHGLWIFNRPHRAREAAGDPQSLLTILMDLWSEGDECFLLNGEGRKIISSMGFHPLEAPEQIAHWCGHIDEVLFWERRP